MHTSGDCWNISYFYCWFRTRAIILTSFSFSQKYFISFIVTTHGKSIAFVHDFVQLEVLPLFSGKVPTKPVT
jgi:hypothetical protein